MKLIPAKYYNQSQNAKEKNNQIRASQNHRHNQDANPLLVITNTDEHKITTSGATRAGFGSYWS